MNDPLYNHTVFGPEKGKGGNIGKSDEKLIADLISIHNAENWLGMDGDSELSMFNKEDGTDTIEDIAVKLLDSGNQKNGENVEIKSRYLHILNFTIRMTTDLHNTLIQETHFTRSWVQCVISLSVWDSGLACQPVQSSKFKRYCKFY